MRKYIYILLAAFALTSCGEYQHVLKSTDANYKLDFAKGAFEETRKRNILRLQQCFLT